MPDHAYARGAQSFWRRWLAVAAAATGAWRILPGRVQGALCNCPFDKGAHQMALVGSDGEAFVVPCTCEIATDHDAEGVSAHLRDPSAA